eukprot:8616180-Pyramimonas_sp.AAC.1
MDKVRPPASAPPFAPFDEEVRMGGIREIKGLRGQGVEQSGKKDLLWPPPTGRSARMRMYSASRRNQSCLGSSSSQRW